MRQQTIEVEGLPGGWKAVAYRKPEIGEYMLVDSKIILCTMQYGDHELRLIVEKIQPRRIVLEETGEYLKIDQCGMVMGSSGDIYFIACAGEKDLHRKIWKEVKE